MHRLLIKLPVFLFFVATLMLQTSTFAEADAGVRLKLDSSSGQVEVRLVPALGKGSNAFLNFTSPDPRIEAQLEKSKVFTIADPARVVIDIPVKGKGKGISHKLQDPFLHELRVGYHGATTRVVLELKDSVPPLFRVESEAGLLLHILGLKPSAPKGDKAETPQKLSSNQAGKELQESHPTEEKSKAELQKSTQKQMPKAQPVALLDTSETAKQKGAKVEVRAAEQSSQKELARYGFENQLNQQKAQEATSVEPSNAKTQNSKLTPPIDANKKRSFSKMPAPPVEETVEEEQILKADTVDYYMGSQVKEYLESLDTETRVVLEEDLRRTGHLDLPESQGNVLEEIEGPEINMEELYAGPDGGSRIDWTVLLSALALVTIGALLLFHYVKRHVSRLQKVREAYEVSVQAIGYGANPLIEQYTLLGCKEDDTDLAIKARYKHLAKVFHSDTLSGQDLPEELVELSTERFRKIQDAYDAVREERGFN